MAAPKYCSWDVKELASDYGWTELPTHPNDEGRMLSFYSSEHGGVRANVYIKTGTVATSLNHPTKGKTQLYRGQRDTFERLEEVFDNPRIHTGSGYQTRAKVNEEEESVISKVIDDGHIEQLRGTVDSDDLEIKDVVADLYRENRFESEADFDGESLMEKLMTKWDEDEQNESDDFVVGGIKETLEMLNDDDYHRSISEVEFSEVTSSSEDEESESEGGYDSVVGNETTEDDDESTTSHSDHNEFDDSIEKDDSDEGSSEIDSANESFTWSEPNSDDSVDSNETEDDYSE